MFLIPVHTLRSSLWPHTGILFLTANYRQLQQIHLLADYTSQSSKCPLSRMTGTDFEGIVMCLSLCLCFLFTRMTRGSLSTAETTMADTRLTSTAGSILMLPFVSFAPRSQIARLNYIGINALNN